MKTLSVQEIKFRLDQGVSDEELMRTYELSPDQLEHLYQELIMALAAGRAYIHIASDVD